MEVLQLPKENSQESICGGYRKNESRRLLNISNIWAFHRPMCDKDFAKEIEGVLKKGRSVLVLLEGKAAAAWASGAYGGVREHDHAARTPLAAFFNIPLGKGRVQCEQLPQLV